MFVYLIRHAHAVDGEIDALRALSGKGRKQARQVGAFLRRNRAFECRTFWESGLVRSSETLELILRELREKKARVRCVPDLEGEADPKRIAARLRRERQTVAIVGHEPHLGALATLLLTGKTSPVIFNLAKGSVLALERQGRKWQARWLISPELVAGQK